MGEAASVHAPASYSFLPICLPKARISTVPQENSCFALSCRLVCDVLPALPFYLSRHKRVQRREQLITLLACAKRGKSSSENCR